MLPFDEAWTGSIIHRRSDTLTVAHSLKLDLHRFCSGRVLMLGGPLFEGHG